MNFKNWNETMLSEDAEFKHLDVGQKMERHEQLKKQKDESLEKELLYKQIRLLQMQNQTLKDELEGANNLLEQHRNGSRVAMLERLLEKYEKDETKKWEEINNIIGGKN